MSLARNFTNKKLLASAWKQVSYNHQIRLETGATRDRRAPYGAAPVRGGMRSVSIAAVVLGELTAKLDFGAAASAAVLDLGCLLAARALAFATLGGAYSSGHKNLFY